MLLIIAVLGFQIKKINKLDMRCFASHSVAQLATLLRPTACECQMH